MIGVCDYRRQVHADRNVVWRALTQSDAWSKIAGLENWFGRVEWFEGPAWRVGSRILIEHFWPSQADIRLVLTSIKPLEEFSWIGHGRGLTAHQQIRVEPEGQDSCVLISTMSFTASGQTAAPSKPDPVADRLLRTFLDAIAEHCERLATGIQKAG
jgi:hypothetical protein